MAAIDAKLKYGVSPSIVHYIATNTFDITENIGGTINYRDCFSEYFLLYWNSHYFMQSMQEGIITKDGIPYLVIFKHELSRGKLVWYNKTNPNKSIQLALSFRNPQPEFNLPAYVLVDGKLPE